MNCQICDSPQETITSLMRHLTTSHPDFSQQQYYDKFLNIEAKNKCRNVQCAEAVKFTDLRHGYLNTRGEHKYCSKSCARSSVEVQQKQRATCEERYGDATYRNVEKRNEVWMEKYGVENVLQKGTESYKKKLKTVKERYGVDNVFQSDIVKKK